MKVRLADKRMKKGLTQEEVANLCGIARTTYAMYEQNKRTPRVSVAKKIAEVLEFDWTLFFEDECHESCNKKKVATSA